MADRTGHFAGDDPVAIAARWLEEAGTGEVNDPNAMALATVDAEGRPNVRIVLLKEIEAGPPGGFVFYTNYRSRKAEEIAAGGHAALVLHWKSLRRQVRVRGRVEREDGPKADAYFASRGAQSRIGAWASRQSQPLADRAALEAAYARAQDEQGPEPTRPPFWGGFRVVPQEIELWADGAARLHDRFRFIWSGSDWAETRLFP